MTSIGINDYCSLTEISEAVDLLNTIRLYPNPAQNRLQIQSDAMIVSLVIYDVKGKLVLELFFQQLENEISIDVQQFALGFCTIQITTQNGVINERFLRQ